MRIAVRLIVGIGSQNYELDSQSAHAVSTSVHESGFPETIAEHEDYWLVPDDNDWATIRRAGQGC
jgi:hypothetical protein